MSTLQETRVAAPAAVAPPRSGRRRGRHVVLHVVLALAGVAMVFPFAWMLLTSLKTLPQLLQDPLSLLPAPATFDNYVQAWTSVPFGRAYYNSIYICLLAVAGTL